MPHTINLPQGSLNLLRSILSIPGILKSVQDYGHGFQIMEIIRPAVPDLPKDVKETDDAFMARMNLDASIELTEAQRDLCKRVLAEKISDMPVSSFGIKLLKSVGLCE